MRQSALDKCGCYNGAFIALRNPIAKADLSQHFRSRFGARVALIALVEDHMDSLILVSRCSSIESDVLGHLDAYTMINLAYGYVPSLVYL